MTNFVLYVADLKLQKLVKIFIIRVETYTGTEPQKLLGQCQSSVVSNSARFGLLLVSYQALQWEIPNTNVSSGKESLTSLSYMKEPWTLTLGFAPGALADC